MTDYGIWYAVIRSLHQVLFPELLRKKVREKFDTQSWVEFCNRLTGVGVIMAVLGGFTFLLVSANVPVEIGSTDVLKMINPVYGSILLVFTWLFLHFIGWVTDGGIPVPFNPTSRIANLGYNVGRMIVGIGMIVGIFLFLGSSSYREQTLIEEVIQFATMVGVLNAIIAPVFYGFGLLGRGVFELVDEIRWWDRG